MEQKNECCNGNGNGGCDELDGTMLGQMKELVDGTIADYIKAKGGGKLAGTRCRKVMLQVKKLALDIRKEIQAIKNEGKNA